jgi:beta-lactam-binding protein with PASTA domain
VVPPVIGVSESTARQALEAVGLSYSVHYEPDGSFPQGTVLTASPEPGSTVPGGSEVALVVAIRPVPSPVEPSPSLSSPPGNE